VRARAHHLRQQALKLDARSRALVDTCLARTCRTFEQAVHRYLQTHLSCDITFFIFAPAGASTPGYLPDISSNGTTRRRFWDGLANDYWYQRHPPLIGKTTIVRHSDHTPVRTLVRTNFFRQNLQPRNLVYGLSLIFWTKTELLGCLTCLRGPRHGDFQDAEIVLLRRIHFDFLRHAVARLAHRYRQEQDFAAVSHAIYLSDEAMVVADGTSRVIAGSKPALRMLQSWNGNGALSHKLPKGKIFLPETMQVWSGRSEPESSSLHPRWRVRLTRLPLPHRRTRTSYVLLRFSSPTSSHQAGSWGELTLVERELVQGLVEGRTNREIARRRGVSPATVKNQLSRLLAKVRLRNRTALAVCFRDAVMKEHRCDKPA
jgi:DNA-binding CsgD family transcriptional regulator